MQARDTDSLTGLSEVLERILALLRNRVGHDFSEYKPTTIRRRIARRMNVHQIADPQQYLRLFQEHPHELDLLFKELLIGVTSFFRDPEAFEQLAQQALPQLLAGKTDTDVVRVWVPGCATGEEAYSLGILLQESLEQAGKHCKVQIFATDIDPQAIEIARRGVYPEGIAADISAERLARFFSKDDASYHIDKAIRDTVIFATHNLLSEPPFTKLDFLSCRNLLIYLEASLQKRLLPMFHYALTPGGFLFLGTSETISGFDQLFTTVVKRWKLFRRKDTVGMAPFLIDYAPRVAAQRSVEHRAGDRLRQDPMARQEMLIDRLLVARYAPPSVIVNERGDIIHIHGRTGAYLEPAPGQSRLNVLAMAREGLRFPLTGALRHAIGREDEVVLDQVRVKSNGGTTLVRVVVQQIVEPEALRSLLRVSFEPLVEVVSPPRSRARSRKDPVQESRETELERELQAARDELQKTREELETSYEEFQSTNEEMQSTNEELQSTNEELESANEELQSLNEELQTVNSELQTKVESLSEAHDDMANLLNSTDIATIFLDNRLHVKRFTSQAREVFHLIQSDTGRPLSDIVSALHYDRLVQDAQEVLQTLGAKDQEVQADTHTWYLMRMRPYRTARNVIDGVVITFVNITPLKQAEEARQRAETARRLAENIVVQVVREPLVIVDAELRVVSANQSFYRYFRIAPEETTQQPFYALSNGQWDIPELRQRLMEVVQRGETLEDFEVTPDLPHLRSHVMHLNARQIQQQPGEPTLVLLAIEDVTAGQRGGEK